MEGSSLSRIDSKSSLEMEPMTLSIDQIHFAREAAIHVLNTMSMEEASNIFTEGLKPVENLIREDNIRGTMLDSDETKFDCYYWNKSGAFSSPRDIATVPF